VFEPLELDGYNYMDGGMVDSVPLRFAKTLQPDLILAVDLTFKGTYKAPNYQQRVLSTMYRTFEIVEQVLVEQALHMHVDHRVALMQPKVGHLHRFDFSQVPSVIQAGEEEALRVLTSHAATRNLVTEEVVEGLSCPVSPGDTEATSAIYLLESLAGFACTIMRSPATKVSLDQPRRPIAVVEPCSISQVMSSPTAERAWI
jgi:hypothetical protein